MNTQAEDVGLRPTPGMRTVSCGCCTDGCVCWNHRRWTPGLSQSLPKCAFHAEHGHPRVTSAIAAAEGRTP